MADESPIQKPPMSDDGVVKVEGPAKAQSILQKKPGSVLKKPRKDFKIDLVFCVDATSSMKPCIDALKANMKAVVTEKLPGLIETKGGNWNPDLRYRLVGFRDCEQDEVRQIEDFGFTSKVDDFVAHVASLEAGGGGDEPESMLDGIVWALSGGGKQETAKLREDAMVAVLAFTDAPSRESVSAMTMKALGLDQLGWTGSTKDVIGLVKSSGARLFLAAPTKGVEVVGNPVAVEMAREPMVFWTETSEKGLADVDVAAFLERVFSSAVKAGTQTKTVLA